MKIYHYIIFLLLLAVAFIGGRWSAEDTTEEALALISMQLGRHEEASGVFEEYVREVTSMHDMGMVAKGSAINAETSLLLALGGDLTRHKPRERKRILAEFNDWQRFFTENTDAVYEAYKDGSIRWLYYPARCELLANHRVRYYSAKSHNQLAFREMQSFSFDHSGEPIRLTYGFHEIEQEYGFSDIYMLLPETCTSWKEGGATYHSGIVECSLKNEPQQLEIHWKDGKFDRLNVIAAPQEDTQIP